MVLFYLINFRLFCGPIYILLKSYILLRSPSFGQIVGHYIPLLNKIFIFVVISSLTCNMKYIYFLGEVHHGLCNLLTFLMKQFLSFIEVCYFFRFKFIDFFSCLFFDRFGIFTGSFDV